MPASPLVDQVLTPLRAVKRDKTNKSQFRSKKAPDNKTSSPADPSLASSSVITPELNQPKSGMKKRRATLLDRIYTPLKSGSSQPRRPASALKRPLKEVENSDSDVNRVPHSRTSQSQSRSQFTRPRSFANFESPREHDLHEAGSRVWVLLDNKGHVFQENGVYDSDGNFEGEVNDGQAKVWIWWPAKVVQRSLGSTLTLDLYGSPSAGARQVNVIQPSSECVSALRNSEYSLRYKNLPLVYPSSKGSKSPRKRAKFDQTALEAKWKDAYASLVEDIGNEADELSDDLPDISEALTMPSRPILTSSPTCDLPYEKADAESGKPDDDDDVGAENSAGEFDELKDELVLAREDSSALYWPAKVIHPVRSRRKQVEPRYRVIYLDNTQTVLPRSWFYTPDEPAFPTCKLGKWHSQFDDDPVDKDWHTHEVARQPSPESQLPLPTADMFSALDIREQFAYVKPILIETLHERYRPGLARHRAFMAGGEKRQQLTKEAGLRGMMNPKDVELVQHYLCEWCLRDERRARALSILDGPDSPGAGSKPSSNDVGGHDTASVLPSIPSPTSTELIDSEPELPPNSSLPANELGRIELADVDMNEDRPAQNVELQERQESQATEPPPTQLRIDTKIVSSIQFSDDGSDVSDLTPFGSPEAANRIPPARQIGGPDYEKLTTGEKLKYCTDVLLPEAIMQILLWRCGHRRSLEMLSDEEEQNLHDTGTQLIRETDWVHDLMRLRESRIRQLESSLFKSRNDDRGSGGRRPRRSVVVGKSYRESDSD